MPTLNHCLKKLNILPLSKLIEYFKLQFMHRYILQQTPASFNNMWVRNEERIRPQDHYLRNQQEFYIQPSRLTSTDNFPLVLFPQLWNNFNDLSIKNITSPATFLTQTSKAIFLRICQKTTNVKGSFAPIVIYSCNSVHPCSSLS